VSQPSTEIHTLAGAFALDALTEFERAAFARHVAECAACDLEVAELRETASRLGALAWEAPPARMRDAVFNEVARTRQVPVGRATVEPREVVAVQRWRRWTATAVAAGVVALGGIATVWVVQEQRVGDVRQQAEQLRREQARIAAVLGASDVRVRTDTATGGGTVIVALSPSLDDGVVMLDGLPEPPAGQAYQLWNITNGTARSAGVMPAGQSGGTALLDSVSGTQTLGVTLEPAGGSDQPSMQPLAEVPLV
jgi:anti-sigma-K factor RskA